MKRRDFLTAAAATVTLDRTAFAKKPVQKVEPLSGVQIAPFSILDEGIQRCLDTLKNNAAINALFIYSHDYYPGHNKPPNVMATDHGIPVRDMRERRLPSIWVKHSPTAFASMPIRHQMVDDSFEYANRDLFDEIRQPATERGMKVYARILEADMRRGGEIPGYRQVRTVDHEGKPGDGPCWNHPDYRQWIYTTIRELVTNYKLDGLQYGAERTGPLSRVLYRGMNPTCFCKYCENRIRELGIDVLSVKSGFTKLHQLIAGQPAKDPAAFRDTLSAVMSILYRHPEMLQFDRQWFLADEEICAEVHRIARSIRPRIDSGRHVDHQRSSWDFFFRSAISYTEMASHADFIKPIVYHDPMGPRLRTWVLDRLNQFALRDLTLDQSLQLFYGMYGHDASKQPSLEQLSDRGLGPEYVYRETFRCKEAVGNQAKVYAGIGIDVPWYVPDGMEPRPSDPETLIRAVHRAFDAGADGVLASREYDEMRLSSLKAFGAAVRTY